jgi:hypothetical protein
MSGKDRERLHPAIDRKLAAIARSAKATLPWHDAWSWLGPESTHEGRLAVCQAVRDAGTLPEADGYFLVCWAVEHLADEEDAGRADPLQTMNTYEGVRAYERTFATLLRKHGEGRMADLFHTNIEDHDSRREAGRLSFFGPDDDKEVDDPDWLDRLLRVVAGRLVASEPVNALAYRRGPGGSSQEVHVLPPAGQSWAVDIEGLREAFEKVEGCGWYASPEKGEVPYLWVEGELDGREVFLRLLPSAEAGKEYQTRRRTV